MRLFAPGCGYVAQETARRILAAGGQASGTSRSAAGAGHLSRLGIKAIIWPGDVFTPPEGACWLVSVPPDDEGCPAFRQWADGAPSAAWIGYLSTTGVYGDLGGRWAFEDTPASPASPEATRRLTAETQWRSIGAHVFRLPGIYGPGRSALERVREPGARRILKHGQVFSRAHRDDIASALLASMARPNPGRVYNICDDEPGPADAVLEGAAALLGIAPPPAVRFEDASLSPAAQRFYAECKRVSNARAKAELGWRPAYPGWRQGLAACLASGAPAPVQPRD